MRRLLWTICVLFVASPAAGTPLLFYTYSFTGVTPGGAGFSGSFGLPTGIVERGPLPPALGGAPAPPSLAYTLDQYLASPGFSFSSWPGPLLNAYWSLTSGPDTSVSLNQPFYIDLWNDFDCTGFNACDLFRFATSDGFSLDVRQMGSDWHFWGSPGAVPMPSVVTNAGVPFFNANEALLWPQIPYAWPGSSYAYVGAGSVQGRLTSLTGPVIAQAPIPEPSTLLFVGSGIGLLLRQRRRRRVARRAEAPE